MAGGKRDDPSYAQVSGYIPKALALRFKITCTGNEITQSDALEQALRAWLEAQGIATDDIKGDRHVR